MSAVRQRSFKDEHPLGACVCVRACVCARPPGAARALPWPGGQCPLPLSPPQKNGRRKPPASGTSTPTASRCVAWRVVGERDGRGRAGAEERRAPTHPFFVVAGALRAPPTHTALSPAHTPASTAETGRGVGGGGQRERVWGTVGAQFDGSRPVAACPTQKKTHPPSPPPTTTTTRQVIVEKAEKSDIPDIDKKK